MSQHPSRAGSRAVTPITVQRDAKLALEIGKLENVLKSMKHVAGLEGRDAFLAPHLGNPFSQIDPSQAQSKPQYKPWLGKAFTSRLLFITIMWQIINVGLLTVIDATTSQSVFTKTNPYYILGIFLMIGCQIIHLFVVLAATIKLAKQLLHHTATAGFLIQSYLSTVILYAGIYTLLHRYKGNVWVGKGGPSDAFPVEGSLDSDTYILKTFIVFFYFSVQTITSVGYGDLTPSVWYLYILVSSEMLLGVFYMVAILGRSLDTILKDPLDRKATLLFRGPSFVDKLKFWKRNKNRSINDDEAIPILYGSA